MMTTPGDFSIYKEAGIKAVCLYYSATPFDAFRVFSRPLTVAEAHNPILYSHPETGEEIAVIPTYNIGDLVENVSLRNWTEKLRRKQTNKEIDKDLLIFVNFDADSDFWNGLDLNGVLDWLPNTNGISGLIEEVKDLEYARFTTVSEYLESHPPEGRFHFGQDTADGSFNGYNSWAEKSSSHWYWTRIQRNRRAHAALENAKKAYEDSPELSELEDILQESYLTRLRALSTTHFGMATPFLAPDRQKAATRLLGELDEYSAKIEKSVTKYLRRFAGDKTLAEVENEDSNCLGSFVLVRTDENRGDFQSGFLRLGLARRELDGRELFLEGPGLRSIKVANLGFSKEKDGIQWLRVFVPRRKGPFRRKLPSLCKAGRRAPGQKGDGRKKRNFQRRTGTEVRQRQQNGGDLSERCTRRGRGKPDALVPLRRPRDRIRTGICYLRNGPGRHVGFRPNRRKKRPVRKREAFRGDISITGSRWSPIGRTCSSTAKSSILPQN